MNQEDLKQWQESERKSLVVSHQIQYASQKYIDPSGLEELKAKQKLEMQALLIKQKIDWLKAANKPLVFEWENRQLSRIYNEVYYRINIQENTIEAVLILPESNVFMTFTQKGQGISNPNTTLWIPEPGLEMAKLL